MKAGWAASTARVADADPEDARPRLDLPAAGRLRHHRRLRPVLHRGRHGEAAAVRQQVGAGGGAEPAGRQQPGGHRAHAVRRRRASSRQLPEVRSVQAYAGTAAPFNFNGLVRHYYMRQSPELGDLQINLADKADRARSSHAIALDLRNRLKALHLPQGTTAAGGGSAARPAGAGDAAGGDLRPGRQDAAGGGAGGEEAVQVGAVHRRCHRFLRPSPAAAAHQHRPGRAGIFRRRAERRVRHDPGAVRRRRRSATRIAAPNAIRSRSSSACRSAT